MKLETVKKVNDKLLVHYNLRMAIVMGLLVEKKTKVIGRHARVCSAFVPKIGIKFVKWF